MLGRAMPWPWPGSRPAVVPGAPHRVRAIRDPPPAPTPTALALAALSVPWLPDQAGPARPGPAHLPASPRADQQAGRAGRVLLRPDLLDRLRHRGDAAGPGRGRDGGDRPRPSPGRRGGG